MQLAEILNQGITTFICLQVGHSTWHDVPSLHSVQLYRHVLMKKCSSDGGHALQLVPPALWWADYVQDSKKLMTQRWPVMLGVSHQSML